MKHGRGAFLGVGVTTFAALATGCSSPPPDDDAKPHTYVEHRDNVTIQHVNERRDPETGKMTSEDPVPKPVETRRMNAGRTDVDERAEDFRPSSLAQRVEIVTWTDEQIRGVLVAETREAYSVDVTPANDPGPRKLRSIPRVAVQTFRTIRSD